MKSLRYMLRYNMLIVLVLLLCITNRAFACGPFYYPPREYHMFHLVDVDSIPDSQMANCRAWQRQTSVDIPLDDIREVVYRYSINDMNRLKSTKATSTNSFAQYIIKNSRNDISDYLILAKRYEKLCDEWRSPWYYPSSSSECMPDTLYAKAVAYTDAPLADRYWLLRMRCLRAMKMEKECLSLYDSIAPRIKHEEVRQLMLPYVFGACVKLKRLDIATRYLPTKYSLTDMRTLYPEKSKMQLLTIMYDGNANNPYVLQTYREMIREMESAMSSESEYGMDSDYYAELEALYSPCGGKSLGDSLRTLATRIATERKTKNTSEWYYTAAFIAYLQKLPSQARTLLAQASRAKHSEETDGAIRVLRMAIDAKYSSLNEAYMNRLHSQLVWLKQKVEHNLTPEIVYDTNFSSQIQINESYYYWNDMIRCIVMGTIAPRLIKSGQTSKALLLQNFADNMMRKLCIRECKNYPFTERDRRRRQYDEWEFMLDSISGIPKDYVYCQNDSSLAVHNGEFFCMMDSMPARQVEAYYVNLTHPQTAFERFLVDGCYTDKNYHADIIGTLYLRERNYRKALRWLERVAPDFQNGYGFCAHTDRSPFEVYKTNAYKDHDYKCNFAREMCHLEEDMHRQPNSDRGGMLMLRYAIGIKNSADWCWSLTEYDNSEYNTARVRRMEHTARVAETLITRAINRIKSREVLAQANYKILNFKTAAMYADTPTGKFVSRHCDNLVDYQYPRRRYGQYGAYSFID